MMCSHRSKGLFSRQLFRVAVDRLEDRCVPSAVPGMSEDGPGEYGLALGRDHDVPARVGHSRGHGNAYGHEKHASSGDPKHDGKHDQGHGPSKGEDVPGPVDEGPRPGPGSPPVGTPPATTPPVTPPPTAGSGQDSTGGEQPDVDPAPGADPAGENPGADPEPAAGGSNPGRGKNGRPSPTASGDVPANERPAAGSDAEDLAGQPGLAPGTVAPAAFVAFTRENGGLLGDPNAVEVAPSGAGALAPIEAGNMGPEGASGRYDGAAVQGIDGEDVPALDGTGPVGELSAEAPTEALAHFFGWLASRADEQRDNPWMPWIAAASLVAVAGEATRRRLRPGAGREMPLPVALPDGAGSLPVGAP